MMSTKEAVMKLWLVKSNLSKLKLDLEEVSHTLLNWQRERIEKNLTPESDEIIDGISLGWQSATLGIAIEQIGKVHERLESDMIINEV